MSPYAKLFLAIHGFPPYDWQVDLADDATCITRLIRISTGLGKTEGVLDAWLYHAVVLNRRNWPRRLVWCLPMRVLVEQTGHRAKGWVDRWASEAGEIDAPQIHLLMGGEDIARWHLEPERPAILIGTQDMLLSRALNRSYGIGRARWPMEYALLNQDCLWVMDEVQLMDVGLATSAQLQAFRDQDREKQLRPCQTWWMSATLQPEWLCSVDTQDVYEKWTEKCTSISPAQRRGILWEISKSVMTDTIAAKDASSFAARIATEHDSLPDSAYGRITLVICNTVDRACATFAALKAAGPNAEVKLVHSRFRPAERAGWREAFLSRSSCIGSVNRIIIATQVVEAGVDISAGCLITDLAPWSSLVQRFGRCARYGGTGRVLVIARGQDERSAAPYDPESLTTAWEAIRTLNDVGLRAIESFEDGLDDDARAKLYPCQPAHLLMRDEFEELFDTTPDLTGADIDISRFIRSGDERDLHIFWSEVRKDERPSSERQPHRDELCAVPFLTARDWLCGPETTSNKKPRLRDGMRAWAWDWLDGEWVVPTRSSLVPGCTVCVDANCGGYRTDVGFSPDSRASVPPVASESSQTTADSIEQADNQQNGEPLSVSQWKTIAFHGSEVAEIAAELAASLDLSPDLARILALAARWHDFGKAHPAFQGKLEYRSEQPRPDRNDLAKGPESAWIKPRGRYIFRGNPQEERPGFRHELASALALFSVLRLYAPEHPALLGTWKEVLEQLGHSIPPPTANNPPAEIQAVLDCTHEEFDLLAYLVASHHGKVRVALHAAPADQNYRPRPGDTDGLPIRGVRSADCLSPIALVPDGAILPEIPLTLDPAALGLSFETGASWRERTHKLIQQYSPTTLGLLEAVLRTADIRASQLATEDPVFSFARNRSEP